MFAELLDLLEDGRGELAVEVSFAGLGAEEGGGEERFFQIRGGKSCAAMGDLGGEFGHIEARGDVRGEGSTAEERLALAAALGLFGEAEVEDAVEAARAFEQRFVNASGVVR